MGVWCGAVLTWWSDIGEGEKVLVGGSEIWVFSCSVECRCCGSMTVVCVDMVLGSAV